MPRALSVGRVATLRVRPLGQAYEFSNWKEDSGVSDGV